MTFNKDQPGKAYGFFDCQAPKKEIKWELSDQKDDGLIPSGLEVFLREDLEWLNGNPELIELAKKAEYGLEAVWPGRTNEATATALADILIQAYQSDLYGAGEPFKGTVVYEENGKIISKE